MADVAWSHQLARNSPARMALWSLAALSMLAAHAVAGWWVLSAPSRLPEVTGPAPAIMVEFADMVMAPAADEQQIAADEVDSIAAEGETQEQDAEEPREESVAAPVEEAVEEAVEEPRQEPVAEAEAALLPEIAPVPQPRPQRPPPRQVARPEPDKPQRAASRPKSADAMQARAVAAAPAPRAAAPARSAGSGASVSPAGWQARVMAHLERRKRYPAEARRARQEGTAQVRFTIDANGNVGSVTLTRSSGVPSLDSEVLALVRRASPIPPPPPGVGHTIVVPIRFNLR